MSEPPFKPPHRLAPIPGVGSSARGVVPVPPVAETPRKRGAIPAAPTSQPRRPADAAVAVEEESTPKDRWAFRYTGLVGAGGENNPEVPLEPVVELPDIRPLTVMFWQDTQFPQPAQPPSYTLPNQYLFEDQTDATGINDGRLRFNAALPGAADVTQIFVAKFDNTMAAVLEGWLIANTQLTMEITYGAQSYFSFAITGYTSESNYLVLEVEHEGSLMHELDTLENDTVLTLQTTGLRRPNAAVRARIKYTAGKLTDVSFDCDWVGSFTLHASRLEISRVGFAPDTSFPYFDAPVDIAATVMADAPPAKSLLQLTVPIADVEPDQFRELLIPSRARRVNLLLRYGDEGASGDAPLGQLFLAFAGRQGRAVTYIDAMSAREALFGVGLPVPAGAVKLVLSNRSPDTSVQLGAIWQLEN